MKWELCESDFCIKKCVISGQILTEKMVVVGLSPEATCPRPARQTDTPPLPTEDVQKGSVNNLRSTQETRTSGADSVLFIFRMNHLQKTKTGKEPNI